MTLQQVLKYIAQVGISQKLINWSGAGHSIYSLNPLTIKDYPIFYVTPTGQHQYYDNFTDFSLTFYYIDRLTEDSSNDIDIFSTGIEVLKNIILALENTDGIIEVNRPILFTNFTETERLSDRCAGAFCQLTIRISNDFVCEIF